MNGGKSNENYSIVADTQTNPHLKQMINESMESYKDGRNMSTSELVKSLSPKDFTK
jgi:hypothetical protein